MLNRWRYTNRYRIKQKRCVLFGLMACLEINHNISAKGVLIDDFSRAMYENLSDGALSTGEDTLLRLRDTIGLKESDFELMLKTQNRLETVVQDDISTAVQEDISTAVQDDISTAVQEDISTAVQDDISTAAQDDASTAVQEDISTAVQEDISTAVQEDISTAVQDDASTAVREDTGTAAQDDASTAVQEDTDIVAQDDISTAKQEDTGTAAQGDVTVVQVASTQEEYVKTLEIATALINEQVLEQPSTNAVSAENSKPVQEADATATKSKITSTLKRADSKLAQKSNLAANATELAVALGRVAYMANNFYTTASGSVQLVYDAYNLLRNVIDVGSLGVDVTSRALSVGSDWVNTAAHFHNYVYGSSWMLGLGVDTLGAMVGNPFLSPLMRVGGSYALRYAINRINPIERLMSHIVPIALNSIRTNVEGYVSNYFNNQLDNLVQMGVSGLARAAFDTTMSHTAKYVNERSPFRGAV